MRVCHIGSREVRSWEVCGVSRRHRCLVCCEPFEEVSYTGGLGSVINLGKCLFRKCATQGV